MEKLNMGYVEVKDVVLFAIAIMGFILSIYNAVKASGRDKVKIKVVPKIYRRTGAAVFATTRENIDLNAGWIGLGIEIRNNSSFAVTISSVGMCSSLDSEEMHFWINPTLYPQGSLPLRLEPHSAVTAYLAGNPIAELLGKKCAFASTANDLTFKGTSPIIKRLIQIGKYQHATQP